MSNQQAVLPVSPGVHEDTRVLLTSGFSVPLDMTEVYKYDRLVRELTQINNINGPYYMQELLEAFNLISHLSARVTHEYERARAETKRVRAVAHLERGPQWLTANQRKVTESACEQYVEMDEEFNKARDREGYLLALMELLSNRIQFFRAAHDDAKRIYSVTSEPRGGTAGAPSGN